MRHVCLCADERFALPLAVALRSLADSQSDPELFHVTVGSFGINADDEARIRASAHPLRIEFVPLDDLLPAGLPTTAQFSRAAFGRCAVIDVLPKDLDRVVYLDCDLIVQADISSLYSFDLGNSAIAAVQSSMIPTVSKGLQEWRSLGIPPATPYMNSGVLVVDVARWRCRELGQSILEFALANHERLLWADQYAFNGVLAGDFARLPLRWNQESSLRQPTHSAYAIFATNEVDEAVDDPAIVHFTGQVKPWQQACDDPATSEWRAVLGRTAYADRDLEGSKTPPGGGRLLGFRRAMLRATRRLLRL